MIDVQFDININEEHSVEDRLLDPTELAMMIDHTKATIEKQLHNKLAKLNIPADEQPLKVVVSGEYSLETEQMDLAYHFDTDNKQLLLQAVMALNH